MNTSCGDNFGVKGEFLPKKSFCSGWSSRNKPENVGEVDVNEGPKGKMVETQ